MNWLGQWENQNGSVLTIEKLDEDQFSGSFVSQKGRAVQDQAYAVHGKINGELIGFVVDFGSVASLVNFSGRLGEDGCIHTLWVLTRTYSDDEHTRKTQPWNSFIVNSDVFHRMD